MDVLEKNKVTIGLAIIAIIALVLFGMTYANNSSDGERDDEFTLEDMEQDLPTVDTDNPVVTLRTSMGDITLELYMDRTPITAGNFVQLAEDGFYTGTKFHRVIDNFMIQGGDPNSRGDDPTVYGQGGPGYTIEDEFDPELSNLRGTISMANIGQPNSGGSQFFINFTNNVGLDFDKQPLTSKHPVFGHVTHGLDVVDAIARTETGPGDVPVTPVVIESIVIHENDASEEGAMMEEEGAMMEDDGVMEEAMEEVPNPVEDGALEGDEDLPEPN